MILIKALKRPTKRSGRPIKPGTEHHVMRGTVMIMNVGNQTLYIDSVSPRKRKAKK